MPTLLKHVHIYIYFKINLYLYHMWKKDQKHAIIKNVNDNENLGIFLDLLQ